MDGACPGAGLWWADPLGRRGPLRAARALEPSRHDLAQVSLATQWPDAGPHHMRFGPMGADRGCGRDATWDVSCF